jgi:hypothetical protein
MTELFNLIFQNFWTWSGTVVLVAVFGSSVGTVIGAIRGGQ